MENNDESPMDKLEERTKNTILKKFRESEDWTQEKEDEILKEFERREAINKIINKIEENAKANISYLLENARHPEETNDEYAIRRTLRSRFEKERKRGYLFHVSSKTEFNLDTYQKKGITYYKPKTEN